MKQKTAYEKNVETWEKRDVWMDVVYLSFDKEIYYDYTIPDKYHVNNRVKKVLPSLKKVLPEKIVKELEEMTFAWKESYSRLEDHMGLGGHIFGNEWFYGYGTLYRWRAGQREKAMERVKKYIPDKEQKYVKIIQDAVRLKINGEKKSGFVKEFGLDKVIGTDND